MRGIGYFREKLRLKRARVLTRYKYYEMKNTVPDFGISTPDELRSFSNVLGWCAKGVDALADRLRFRGFDDDFFNVGEIYAVNNRDILFSSAILGALIGSCDFIYISAGEDGYPRMQVIDGANATGEIDPITYLLKEGYAVLERESWPDGEPTVEAYFYSGMTEIWRKGARAPERYKNAAPYALLVPIIYRPDARRPFGHSRISRACMSIVNSAARTLKRSEISAEFYSFPQKYVLGFDGLDENGEKVDRWKMSISTLMTISRDEDGGLPTVGEFKQQSMQPHTDQLRMFAALFAGETGLTLDDLGFATDNPSSAEAIKAGHESLRLAVRKAQDVFGVGFINAGYLAACVRDDRPYLRYQLRDTIAKWEPAFEPDAAQLGHIGDGIAKINTAVPGYISSSSLYDLTGIKPGV